MKSCVFKTCSVEASIQIHARTTHLTLELLVFAAQLLGFSTYIPPYARARGPALLRGANFASGAAGIRDETGTNLVSPMEGSGLIYSNTILKLKSIYPDYISEDSL